jgi:hypothetical protein
MEVHDLSTRHQFRIGQVDDEGFPIDRLHPEIRPTIDVISRQIMLEPSRLVGMLDMPVNVAWTATFHQFVIKLMEHGIEISHLALDADLAEAMMALSHVTLADALYRCWTKAFSQRPEIIRRDHRLVNLLCDVGTVVTIQVVHAALSSPSSRPSVLPLEAYANTN